MIVCPSVCLSITLLDYDHIGCNSSKIISRTDSLGCSHSADLNSTDLFQREHSEMLAGIGEGYRKVDFCVVFWGQFSLRYHYITKAWRQALRHIWKLPYNCHTAILERLSGTMSTFDTLCKRSLNSVQKCLNSENVW